MSLRRWVVGFFSFGCVPFLLVGCAASLCGVCCFSLSGVLSVLGVFWFGFPLARVLRSWSGWLLGVFGVLLFCGWGGFFWGWGGFFRGWAVLGVSFFFVALLCSLVWCCGRSFVLFGFCRGCFRWPACLAFFVRWVCGLRLRGWRVSVFGPRGCRVSCLRRCSRWARVVRLVGRVVGRFVGGWLLGCLGVVGWRCRSWRPAFSLFLVFFNICRARLWHPLLRGAFFAALDGGIMAVEMT